MNTKADKGEEWRFIGHNVPQVEIYGPYSNQYRVFVEDIDGDLIGLLPADIKRLIPRLEKALEVIADRRKKRVVKTA